MSGTLKRWLPGVIIAFAVIVFITLKATRPEQASVHSKERVWYVDTVTIQPRRLAPILTLYGQVETPDRMKAAAPGSGRVHQVLVREGARVSPSQLLLTLDPRDFQPKVLQSEARIRELQARIEGEQLRYASDREAIKHDQSLLELSRLAVERAEKMKKQKLGSDAALDQTREAYERQGLALTARKLALDDHTAREHQLQAQLKQAEAERTLAHLDLERSQVYAPFSGYVARVDVAAGDQVNANQLLLSLYPIDSLEVRAKIPAPFHAELQNAIVRGEPLHASADYAGEPLILTLDRLAGEADPRGIDAFFRIDQGAGHLRLGSRLSLVLQRPSHAHAVALPSAALYGSHRIYKLVDGRLQGVDVLRLGETIDANGSSEMLVTSPQLKKGDRIVTSHLPNAVTGLRAEPFPDQAAKDAT